MAIDLQKINDTPHLLELLIEMEDVLDSLDVYVYKNWIKGVVVDGPTIRRYWVSFILEYKENEMPDPRAAMRLLKHGIMTTYDRGVLERVKNMGAEKVWLVKIEFPRKLLNSISGSDTDFYDDEVDIDDVDSAIDMGVDNESGVDSSATDSSNDANADSEEGSE